MKAVIQRVKNACVSVDGRLSGSIDEGLLLYLGVAKGDSEDDAEWIASKTANIRIFRDDNDKMNLSVKDLPADSADDPASPSPGKKRGVLCVSQFTLLGDARKGRRPYFGNAAAPEEADRLYEYCMQKIREEGLICESGVFQTHMEVSYTNDGPVTILLDSRDRRD
jgi:D-tyrosyl-tRNA(Tyr) deacylase